MDPQDFTQGGAESLRGRITLQGMGSKAVRQTKPTSESQPTYKPVTKQNRQIYEIWLSKCKRLMQDLPQDIMLSVADEILIILKSEKTEQEKIDAIKVLIKIDSEAFNELVTVGNLITDYRLAKTTDVTDTINLQIESDQEAHPLDPSSEEEEQVIIIPARIITREWLKNQLKGHEIDVLLCEDIIQALGSNKEIESERKLTKIVGPENLQFVQWAMPDRKRIYFCILYNQAESASQRKEAKTQISMLSEGQKLLQELGAQNEELSGILQMSKQKGVAKLAKKILDLKSIIENQQEIQLARKASLLPGYQKVQHPGYQEIVIPPPKQLNHTPTLVQISTLPLWTRPAFSSIKLLNPIQSQVCHAALESPDNLLISAPTGAGKTNIAVLAMLQAISNYRDQTGGINSKEIKIVYIAPMKALVAEITGSLSSRLQYLGLKVKELTGDMQLSRQQIDSTQIIVATPQKWDIVTRKAGERTFLEKVRLLIIDQIHLLADQRGAVLEAIIARTIRTIQSSKNFIRIVGLSATLPNFKDIAALIRAPTEGAFFFGGSYRPIPLTQRYIGIHQKKGARKLLLQNQILYEMVEERAGHSQMIIFVHSRKDTFKTGEAIREYLLSRNQLPKLLKEDSDSKKLLQEMANRPDSVISPHLKALLPFGIGIHHAGLERSDRELAESLFAGRHLQILVSTATLAWGVNLPAQTVIIKSTQVYKPEVGRWVPLAGQQIMQMLGRSGRPAYDLQGEGIIITSTIQIDSYLNQLNAQVPLQSRMLEALYDQVNAEVVLGTVQSIDDLVEWLTYTYLYIRMLKNPRFYGITEHELKQDPTLLRRRANLAHTALSELDRLGLVHYDRRTGAISSSSLGRVSSHYYIKHQSMSVFKQHLKSQLNLIELLRVFSLSAEFKHIPVREEQKAELKALADIVPVPIKGAPEERSSKVNILLQAYISRLSLAGYALNCDMIFIKQNAARITRGIFQICLGEEWANATLLSLELAKAVERGMWSCMNPLRQFKQVPRSIIAKFEKKEQFVWDNIVHMNPHEIGELVKMPKLSKVLYSLIRQVPRLELDAYAQPVTRSCLRIELTIKRKFQWQTEQHGRQEVFWLMVTDCDQQHLLYSQELVLSEHQVQLNLMFTLPIFQIPHPLYYLKVISHRWIAPEAMLPLSFKNMVMPAKFPSPTPVQDLTLWPAEELSYASPGAQRLLQMLGIKVLNRMQSQCIWSFIESQKNLLLTSAPGSGRIVNAILLLNQHLQEDDTKILFLVGCKAALEKRYTLFKRLFQHLRLPIGKIVGHVPTDSDTLIKSRMLVSAPQSWDILTRRWRARKGLDKLTLVVLQDLQLLSSKGSSLEVAISRLRYISSQLPKPTRFVGLATSISNYMDLAEWIGVSKQQAYGFSCSTRPDCLQVEIKPFVQSHFQTRQQAIRSFILQQYKERGKPQTIVFAGGRRQTIISAIDMATTLAVTSPPNESTVPEKIKDKFLLHVLGQDIGYLYSQMPECQRQILLDMFADGLVRLLVIDEQMACNLQLKAPLVFVLDTHKPQFGHIHHSLAEVFQMQSYAHGYSSSHFFLCCHASRATFYSKFLAEGLPLESQLNVYLAQHVNAEAVSKTIQSKQDCMDWLSWTFMYRRLLQNPNYYNLKDSSTDGLAEYLSDLTEEAVELLERATCVEVQNELEISALNMGIIAAYYNIQIQTLLTFLSALVGAGTIKDICALLVKASQFKNFYLPPEQEAILAEIVQDLGIKHESIPSSLLEAHLNRVTLPASLKPALIPFLEQCPQLLHALADVVSSQNQLKQLLLSIHVSQMIIQGQRLSDSKLVQLQLGEQEINRLEALGIKDVYDFVNAEDEERGQLTSDTIEAVNRYPFVQMTITVTQEASSLRIQVLLEREGELSSPLVYAPNFPKEKEESWWVVVGQKKRGRVFGTKRVSVRDRGQATLLVQRQEECQVYTVYGLCDSYLGCDQQQEFKA